MARDGNVNHFSRSHINQEEAEQTPEQQIRHLKKVTRPDVLGMIVDEGQPGLGCVRGRFQLALVALDGRAGRKLVSQC